MSGVGIIRNSYFIAFYGMKFLVVNNDKIDIKQEKEFTFHFTYSEVQDIGQIIKYSDFSHQRSEFIKKKFLDQLKPQMDSTGK